MLNYAFLFRFEYGEETILFVADDHDAFINTHSGRAGHRKRLCCDRYVLADDGRFVGLVASTALIGEQTVGLAIEIGFNDIIDSAEVYSLDLNHIGSLGVDPLNYLFVRVGVFVDYELETAAGFVALVPQILPCFKLFLV